MSASIALGSASWGRG